MIVVLNADTLGVSEWDLAASEVVVHNGVPLFLTAAGVEGFDPAADAPAAYVETGALNLSPGAVCTVSRADASLSTDQALTLRATAEGFGPPVTTDYVIPPAHYPSAESERKVLLGRGVRGSSWTLRLGSSGGGWSLGALSVGTERRSRTGL